MSNFGFDLSDVEVSERNEFEVMPKGEYSLKAAKADVKVTKDSEGSYLSVEFEIARGNYTGRKIWQNFTINNRSEKAQKIGREQIAGWARACGKPNAKDTDELIECVFNARVDVEKGQNGYPDKNKIVSFLIANNNQSQNSQSSQNPQSSQPVAKAKNPWDD